MTDTRRQFLRAGGTALAAALTTAGCIDDSSDGTPTAGGAAADETATAEATATEADATATETATPTATETPAAPSAGFAQWLPTPAAIGEEGGYAFATTAPAAIVDLADALGDGAASELHSEHPLEGIDTYADLTALHRVGRSTNVLVGEFDRGTAADALRDGRFSEAGTHEGYDLFDADGPRAAALGDGVFVATGPVSSSDDDDKLPVVEAVLDARLGNAERYPDADADCDRLLADLSGAHLLQGRTHEAGATFDGAVAEGYALRLGAEESEARAAVVFAEGETDADAVSEWASDADAFYGAEPTTEADGRGVTATATIPSDEVRTLRRTFPGPDLARESTAPQVSFEFEYESREDDAGLLTVEHHGGDHVPVDELRVLGGEFVDVEGADQTEPGPWQGTASGDDGDAVAAGDAVTLGVASDYQIVLVWQGDGGTAELARDEGPDA